MSIHWLTNPPDIPDFRRIAYAHAPDFVQRNYGPRKDLYEFCGPKDLEFVYKNKWYIRVRRRPNGGQGPICDLTSVPKWIPSIIASKSTRDNYLDIGSLVHDLIHMGCARFPNVEGRMAQATLADGVMRALWQDRMPLDAGRWKRGKPTRKWVGVRALSLVMFRPQDNRRTDWITIVDLESEYEVSGWREL